MIQKEVLAQSGANDISFNPTDVGNGFGDRANRKIIVQKEQSDGKILIAGEFTSYNGVNRNFIARIHADGSLDESFNPGIGANNSIMAIAVQADGKILIGGAFTNYNGVIRSRIARLNSNGSLDTSFDPSAGADNLIRALALRSDGSIIIGGNFSNYNGINRNRMAILNADGSLDLTSNIGTGPNSIVRSIIVEPSDKSIIGGDFTSFNGIAKNRVVRINNDGSLDAAFASEVGANNSVYVVRRQADGKIVIGGTFTSYNASGRNRIARLLPDGTLDETFDIGTGLDNTVNAISLQADNKVLAVGTFTSFRGVESNRIIRINNDGTTDESFLANSGSDGEITSVEVLSSNKIMVCGDFGRYNTKGNKRIVLLNADGTKDMTSFNYGGGANDAIITSVLQPDGKIVIAGLFTQYNGQSKNNVARLNSDGSLDNTFDAGLGCTGKILVMAIQPDGKILIGGNFNKFNGITRNNIVRLNADGSVDNTFDPGAGTNSFFETMVLQPDGKIIIGGVFVSYNGEDRRRIARLNANGSLDNSFNPENGFDGPVRSLTLQADGKIVVVGSFNSYNGVNGKRIIRLNSNGTIDNTFNSGTGVNGNINTVSLQPDGKILIGGTFSKYDGTNIQRIARILSNGTLDTSFVPGDGPDAPIQLIFPQADGTVIVGGNFGNYSGVNRNRIARILSNGSLDISFDPGVGLNAELQSVLVQEDGNLIISGYFTAYNTKGRNRIARLLVAACSLPTVPTLGTSATTICKGEKVTLSLISGNLNGASQWKWYSNSCGGDLQGSGVSIEIRPTSTTTYFVRGEGGCAGGGICGAIQVNVRPDAESISNVSICSSQLPYMWNGNTYPSAGSYLVTLKSKNGCDSLARLKLTVSQMTFSTNIQEICDSSLPFIWNGNQYNASGEYQIKLINKNGCDSLATLKLVVKRVDAGFSVTGFTATSFTSNDSYQWLDCNNSNAPIAGATENSFTPKESGSYALRVTKNGCEATSMCKDIVTVGLENSQTMFFGKIFPNPVSEVLSIEEVMNGATIKILNALGEPLESFQSKGEGIRLTIKGRFEPGVYFISIQYREASSMNRIVISD